MNCPICGNEIAAGLSTCPFCLSSLTCHSSKKSSFLHRTINLEEGRPTAEMAVNRMTEIIHDAARRKVSVLTFIHGYGSSGKGGRIRTEARKMLAYLKDQGSIRDYIAGESFHKRSGEVKQLLQKYPQLAADKNLGRGNKGVTLVILPF